MCILLAKLKNAIQLVLHYAAPLFPLNPLAYQMRGSNPQILQVEFNQPYSVSVLRYINSYP